MSFGERLRTARENKGMTQKALAEAVGVSQQYYGRFEKGEGEPNLKTLELMTVILEVSADHLISGDDECKSSGDRLKRIRVARGMTQEKLATVLETGKTTVSNYETGYSEPNFEILIKICKSFNVSSDYLLGMKGE